MSTPMTNTEVRTAVTVAAPIEHAFEVFTQRFDQWWPQDYKLLPTELDVVVLEPRVGGRWYERGTDGSECEWGKVLAWDPPNHVALSWAIDTRFRPDPDPERASRVDVRFTAEGPTATRVELVHSQLDRHGEGWEAMANSVHSDGGWNGILRAFAAAATT